MASINRFLKKDKYLEAGREYGSKHKRANGFTIFPIEEVLYLLESDISILALRQYMLDSDDRRIDRITRLFPQYGLIERKGLKQMGYSPSRIRGAKAELDGLMDLLPAFNIEAAFEKYEVPIETKFVAIPNGMLREVGTGGSKCAIRVLLIAYARQMARRFYRVRLSYRWLSEKLGFHKRNAQKVVKYLKSVGALMTSEANTFWARWRFGTLYNLSGDLVRVGDGRATTNNRDIYKKSNSEYKAPPTAPPSQLYDGLTGFELYDDYQPPPKLFSGDGTIEDWMDVSHI